MKFMREQMRFDEIFDQWFYEYELGIGKPHKQFYQIMLDTLARDHDITDPSEIHIWDDRQKYLDPAEKMWMQTHVYTGFESFSSLGL